jgi:hypothetical protein
VNGATTNISGASSNSNSTSGSSASAPHTTTTTTTTTTTNTNTAAAATSTTSSSTSTTTTIQGTMRHRTTLKIALFEFEKHAQREYYTGNLASLPPDQRPRLVNDFGLPPLVMRCFEMADTMLCMHDLIRYSVKNNITSPLDALRKFCDSINRSMAAYMQYANASSSSSSSSSSSYGYSGHGSGLSGLKSAGDDSMENGFASSTAGAGTGSIVPNSLLAAAASAPASTSATSSSSSSSAAASASAATSTSPAPSATNSAGRDTPRRSSAARRPKRNNGDMIDTDTAFAGDVDLAESDELEPPERVTTRKRPRADNHSNGSNSIAITTTSNSSTPSAATLVDEHDNASSSSPNDSRTRRGGRRINSKKPKVKEDDEYDGDV